MAIDPRELAVAPRQASLPTYQTIAAVLEKQTGSGIKLAGWTVARSALIAVPMMLVKVEPRKAILGSLLASAFISLFAVIRIYNAEFELSREYLRSRKWTKPRKATPEPPRALQRMT